MCARLFDVHRGTYLPPPRAGLVHVDEEGVRVEARVRVSVELAVLVLARVAQVVPQREQDGREEERDADRPGVVKSGEWEEAAGELCDGIDRGAETYQTRIMAMANFLNR